MGNKQLQQNTFSFSLIWFFWFEKFEYFSSQRTLCVLLSCKSNTDWLADCSSFLLTFFFSSMWYAHRFRMREHSFSSVYSIVSSDVDVCLFICLNAFTRARMPMITRTYMKCLLFISFTLWRCAYHSHWSHLFQWKCSHSRDSLTAPPAFGSDTYNQIEYNTQCIADYSGRIYHYLVLAIAARHINSQHLIRTKIESHERACENWKSCGRDRQIDWTNKTKTKTHSWEKCNPKMRKKEIIGATISIKIHNNRNSLLSVASFDAYPQWNAIA